MNIKNLKQCVNQIFNNQLVKFKKELIALTSINITY
jgi:hypothetical protein